VCLPVGFLASSSGGCLLGHVPLEVLAAEVVAGVRCVVAAELSDRWTGFLRLTADGLGCIASSSSLFCLSFYSCLSFSLSLLLLLCFFLSFFLTFPSSSFFLSFSLSLLCTSSSFFLFFFLSHFPFYFFFYFLSFFFLSAKSVRNT
jgi:hypothetical protein